MQMILLNKSQKQLSAVLIAENDVSGTATSPIQKGNHNQIQKDFQCSRQYPEIFCKQVAFNFLLTERITESRLIRQLTFVFVID